MCRHVEEHDLGFLRSARVEHQHQVGIAVAVGVDDPHFGQRLAVDRRAVRRLQRPERRLPVLVDQGARTDLGACELENRGIAATGVCRHVEEHDLGFLRSARVEHQHQVEIAVAVGVDDPHFGQLLGEIEEVVLTVLGGNPRHLAVRRLADHDHACRNLRPCARANSYRASLFVTALFRTVLCRLTLCRLTLGCRGLGNLQQLSAREIAGHYPYSSFTLMGGPSPEARPGAIR